MVLTDEQITAALDRAVDACLHIKDKSDRTTAIRRQAVAEGAALAGEVIRDLIAVATGQVEHVYHGRCPDKIEGHATRDHECPACRAITAAEQLAK